MRRIIRQSGFTLVEMIMVIVITGIIGGMVAVFLRTPIQQYMDVARRAELTDIADTALRRLGRDIRTAVPNSVRIAGCGGMPCVEFLPARNGGRYRASTVGGGTGCGAVADAALDFAAPDTCFEIVGSPMTFLSGDQIVVGSTQSDGNPPYQDPGAAACTVAATTTCIRRPVAAAGVGANLQVVKVDSAAALPAFSELSTQRFTVVDGVQQAVTYACVGTLGTLDANRNGQARLMRYWGYGFKPGQIAPPTVVGGGDGIGALAHAEAMLADKVSACEIVYDLPNQRFGLLAVRLALTSGGESVNLYHEIHVTNAP